MKVENLSGKEIKQTYYVLVTSRVPDQPFLSQSDWSKDSPTAYCSYICYGQVEINYTVPNADPHKKALDSIDGQIESLRAEFQHNLDLLVEKKQQLLAIGYSGSDDSVIDHDDIPL